MLLKSSQTPEQRRKTLVTIGGIAQIALVTGIILSRLDINGLDFFEGVLFGFSTVGNLAVLYYFNRGRQSS